MIPHHKRAMLRKAQPLIIVAACLASMPSQSMAQERVYSVIEFLANQGDLVGKPAKIKGTVACTNVVDCTLSGEARAVYFTAVKLPEADRVALLKSGTPGSPLETVTLTVLASPPGYSGVAASSAIALERAP